MTEQKSLIASAVPVDRRVKRKGSVRRARPPKAPTVPPASARRTAGEKLPPSPFSFEPDSHASTAFSEVIDRSLHALAARFTLGLSPSALAGAYWDWAIHLALSPGKQFQLIEKAAKKQARLARYSARCATRSDHVPECIEPLPQDRRFRDEGWRQWPFNLMHQAFLLNQQWWHNATTGVRGVTGQHENVVEFAARQMLDVWSPSNFPLTNPEVLDKTAEEGGLNLVRGLENLREDVERLVSGDRKIDTGEYVVGETLATTRGKVVYRNRLIELIQYEPVSKTVRPEPILIVPAWIMKYYILDLASGRSLIEYLVGEGFTVFAISWKNPGQEDRDLGMSDYRTLGVMRSLDVIQKICNCEKVHGVGYCLGGTLLTIAAAAMARDGDERLATLSLLAAQTDFSEAGELTLFINESQVAFLEDMMWEQGYLDAKQMAGAFQLLRSNDLVWSRMVRDYLMGERRAVSDLMAWNADATRMPYKMHSQYLRQLFLNNELAQGKYLVGDRPVSISDIRVPTFAVGTEWDHVAPWRSVYKLHSLADTDVTFLLTNGGHNAGIVSQPGHPRRHYRVSIQPANARHRNCDEWFAETAARDGSWWPEFAHWLAVRSRAAVAPPPLGVPDQEPQLVCDAPGTYVFQG